MYLVDAVEGIGCLVVGYETDHLSSNLSKCRTVLRKLGYSIHHCNVM
jgi:hypothetical protein